MPEDRSIDFLTDADESPEQDLTGPSTRWYVVAAAIFAVAAVAAFVLGQGASDKLDTTIVPLGGDTLTVEDQARSVFVAADAGSDASCTAKPPGSRRVQLSPADTPLSVEIDDRRWIRVGTTTDMVTGDYALTCTTAGGDQVATDDIGVATDPNFGGAALRVGLAFAIPILAAIVAVSIAGIVFYRRRRAAVLTD